MNTVGESWLKSRTGTESKKDEKETLSEEHAAVEKERSKTPDEGSHGEQKRNFPEQEVFPERTSKLQME